MGVNKVVYGGNTLIDISGDTVTAAHLEQGYTAHGANGNAIMGTLVPGGGDLPNPIVAGDTPVKGSVGAGTAITSSSMTSTGLSITITKAGTYRFKWTAHVGTATSANIAHTRLYKNNSAAGSDHTMTSDGNRAFSEDIVCAAGDTITVRAQAARSLSTYAVHCSGLIACIDWDNGL